jgi:hypothetical protein
MQALPAGAGNAGWRYPKLLAPGAVTPDQFNAGARHLEFPGQPGHQFLVGFPVHWRRLQADAQCAIVQTMYLRLRRIGQDVDIHEHGASFFDTQKGQVRDGHGLNGWSQ